MKSRSLVTGPTQTPVRRAAGGFLLLMGIILFNWVGYNLLVHRLPATEGKSPIMALLFGAGLCYVGVRWVRGWTAKPVAILIVAMLVASALVQIASIHATRRARAAQDTSDLMQIGLAYHWENQSGNPPQGIEDLEPHFGRVSHSGRIVQGVRDGDYVVIWNAPFPRGVFLGQFVLGYAGRVPQAGGPVLLADGAVKELTAVEFAARPKIPTPTVVSPTTR